MFELSGALGVMLAATLLRKVWPHWVACAEHLSLLSVLTCFGAWPGKWHEVGAALAARGVPWSRCQLKWHLGMSQL